jgi:hypothetical protein
MEDVKLFLLRYQPVFAAIVFVCGVYMMLIAFGVLRISRDPSIDERWRRERAPLMKVASSVMVVASLIGLAVHFF